MEIISTRLLLREFTGADLPALTSYQADARYAEFLPQEAPHRSPRELLGMFQRWVGERPRRNFQLAVARLRTPQELIGTCGLRSRGCSAGTAEFGIELASRLWGCGYATEAAGALLRFGFRELGLQEVRGVSVTENARVAQMALRLGFTQLGLCPGPAWMDARGWNQTEWQLTREQWTR